MKYLTFAYPPLFGSTTVIRALKTSEEPIPKNQVTIVYLFCLEVLVLSLVHAAFLDEAAIPSPFVFCLRPELRLPLIRRNFLA
jgi:hypothetical protein